MPEKKTGKMKSPTKILNGTQLPDNGHRVTGSQNRYEPWWAREK